MKMGNAFYIGSKDTSPMQGDAPTFDPLLGFPNGRKQRVMIATEQEMNAAKLTPEQRDYCAHLLLKLLACRADVFPFVYKCAHEKHVVATCEFEDYMLRLKEFEREKRLQARQKRKLQAVAA